MPRTSSALPRSVAAGFVALDGLYVAGRGTELTFRAGGTAGNVAAILGAFGWASDVLGPSEASRGARLLVEDFHRCGVEYHAVLTGEVPIIIEELVAPARHRFLFHCPVCGRALPRYRSARVTQWHTLRYVSSPDVFFADRLSDDILALARHAQANGAFVVYEPSDPSDAPWATNMIAIAHMVKYASDRAQELPWLDSTQPLEVCTLGAEGLRWRWPAKGVRDWKCQSPAPVRTLVDTCGAGDWLTAGILVGLLEGAPIVPGNSIGATTQILHRAQLLAAWSCGFEGARGGLYADGAGAGIARALLRCESAPACPPLGDGPALTGCAVCPD